MRKLVLYALLSALSMMGGNGAEAGQVLSTGDADHPVDISQGNELWRPAPEPAGAYVLETGDRGVQCRAATEAEARRLQDRDPDRPLRFIKGGDEVLKSQRAVTGLSIQLRATDQLDSYPEAKAAFIRAAERWESVILDPISIIIDVDFGPTRFGTPFPSPRLLGSTSSDLRSGAYSELAPAMLARSPSTPLYQKLPASAVPTDHGNATTAFASSSSLRMLGLLAAMQSTSDPSPSIGFNSAQPFDFDPTNGVNADRFDFDAVVTHEIGHVLGFNSLVGDLELHPTHTLGVSSWDLFRFRAAISVDTFASTPRVLSSGGAHVFSDGMNVTELSTGRADGSGGDGHQASHWQDVVLHGSYIGIMVPLLPNGFRAHLTGWDLLVPLWLGYAMAPASVFNRAFISSVSPSSVTAGGAGFVLTVDGSEFLDGAAVLWKGSPRPTTFVSTTRVTAAISSSDIASLGEVSIEVVNPGAIPSSTLYVSITGLCAPSSTSLCLSGGRFNVTASWLKSDGTSGQGVAVSLTDDTGYFWFFGSSNVETITKVLNACVSPFNHYWVFAAGLTNVHVKLTYTDSKTGTVREYMNPLGIAFQPIQDTAAFATCP